MSTCWRSAPMSFASTRITFGRPALTAAVTASGCPARRRGCSGGRDSALPNHQSATLALRDDFPREIDGSLAAPAGDQPVDFLDVAGEEGPGRGTGLDGGAAQDAAAYGGRQGVELGALQQSRGVAY